MSDLTPGSSAPDVAAAQLLVDEAAALAESLVSGADPVAAARRMKDIQAQTRTVGLPKADYARLQTAAQAIFAARTALWAKNVAIATACIEQAQTIDPTDRNSGDRLRTLREEFRSARPLPPTERDGLQQAFDREVNRVRDARTAAVQRNAATAATVIAELRSLDPTARDISARLKALRTRFRDAQPLPQVQRDRLRDEFNAAADAVAQQQKAAYEQRQRDRASREAKRAAQRGEYLDRLTERARKVDDQIRRAKDNIRDLERRLQPAADHLRREYGLFGNRPLHRNSDQRSTEAQVSRLEGFLHEAKERLHSLEASRREVENKIREVRDGRR